MHAPGVRLDKSVTSGGQTRALGEAILMDAGTSFTITTGKNFTIKSGMGFDPVNMYMQDAAISFR